MRFRLDKFCQRQWDANYVGTRMVGITKEEFFEKFLAAGPHVLVDGYAPFCKHVFVRNFVPGVVSSTVRLDDNTRALVRSDYVARTERELPVLVRWIPAAALPAERVQQAQWLDVILYSKQQIVAENRANGSAAGEDTSDEDYDWGIISIKAQDVNFELPMTPITMMRNALGKEEGGSGVPLDKNKYAESVKFWSENVTIM